MGAPDETVRLAERYLEAGFSELIVGVRPPDPVGAAGLVATRVFDRQRR